MARYIHDMKTLLKNLNRWEMLFLIVLSALWSMDRPSFFAFFLLLPIFWLGGYLRQGCFFPPTPLDIPLLLLSLWTLVSLAVTPDLAHSAGKVLGVVLGISLYYAIFRLKVDGLPREIQSKKRENIPLWSILGYLITGTGIAVLGLLGADWFDKFPFLTRAAESLPDLIPSLPGAVTGFQPNAISGTLTLFTPVSVLLAWQYFFRDDKLRIHKFDPFPRWLIKGILLVILLCQGLWWLLAQTRGAWLGLAASLLFLGILLFKPRWNAVAWIFSLVLVALAYLYWVQAEDLGNRLRDLNSFGGDNLSGTLAFRFQIWEWAGLVLQDFPFTGLGYNMFREVVPILYFGPRLGDVAHAHNIWLDIGVTLGFGGIVIYLALWMINGYSLWQVWLQHHDHWGGQIALALLAGWYAYFIFGLADTIPLGSKLGLGIFLSLGVGQVIVKTFTSNEQAE